MANIIALKQLVRVLTRVRDEHRPFDMSFWVSRRTGSSIENIPLLTTPVENCGTASCAAGWAARDPWFIEKGFRLIDDSGTAVPCYLQTTMHKACESFFDLDHEEEDHIFSGEIESDVQLVLDRVEQLIAHHEAD